MGISPFAVGQLLPIMQVQLFTEDFVTGSTGVPVDLTGLVYSNFSLNMYNTTTRSDTPGAGIFIVVGDPTQGIIQYAWDAADTDTAGVYQLFISANFLGGPLIFDPIPFVIVQK